MVMIGDRAFGLVTSLQRAGVLTDFPDPLRKPSGLHRARALDIHDRQFELSYASCFHESPRQFLNPCCLSSDGDDL